MNGSKQIKLGALISYLAIIFNIVAGLIYTPWMISHIGQDNYGLYTLATSLITLFVMDFGMSATVTRFMSKYVALGDIEKANGFLGLVYKIYIAIDAVIFIVLIVIYFFIESIYGNLTASEIETLKQLYIVVGLFSVISFPFTNLNGILVSYEKFVELKLCDLFHKIFIIVAMVVALLMGYGVLALVLVNALSGLFTIVLKIIIINRKTATKVNFKYKEKGVLKEIFGFSMWTTISGIMERITFNILPTVIASVSLTGSKGVAIFGLAITIEGYIFTLASAVNGMFMPRIAKIISKGEKEKLLMPLMIKVGRIQLSIVGIMTVGFISLGQSFVTEIWDKAEFAESYLCAILLTLPSVFFLPMQIAGTTLSVENKVNLRAYILTATALINMMISFPLIKFYGATGASASIFVSYMIRTALMVIVYKKVLLLDMKSFFKETFLKLSPYLFLSLGVGLLCEAYNPIENAYLRFLVNGIILVMAYFFLMYFKGFNEYEKNLIKGILLKVKRRG